MFDELEMDDDVDLWSEAREVMKAAERKSETDGGDCMKMLPLIYEAVFAAPHATLVVRLNANHPGEAIQEAWRLPDPEGFEYLGTRNASPFGDWIY
jgi:hypothetical protein